jgi:hypothetical protein
MIDKTKLKITTGDVVGVYSSIKLLKGIGKTIFKRTPSPILFSAALSSYLFTKNRVDQTLGSESINTGGETSDYVWCDIAHPEFLHKVKREEVEVKVDFSSNNMEEKMKAIFDRIKSEVLRGINCINYALNLERKEDNRNLKRDIKDLSFLVLSSLLVVIQIPFLANPIMNVIFELSLVAILCAFIGPITAIWVKTREEK